MSKSVSGTLRKVGPGSAQIPANKLADHARAVMADLFGGGPEVIPEVVLQPNAPDFRDLPLRFVRHDGGVYGLYRYCTAHVEGHGCTVRALYIHCKDSAKRMTHRRQLLADQTAVSFETTTRGVSP